MKKPRKSPREIEALIMLELKSSSGCEGIAGVTVRSLGAPGGWEARPVNRAGAVTASADCWARLRRIEHDLRRRFDLSAYG